jgi:hypothetical protein
MDKFQEEVFSKGFNIKLWKRNLLPILITERILGMLQF